ncbi:uncharacterized protein LOC121389869 [Gigantopelta aegis]|uniref:uncharacterized protein LOC121389869 n=1 Tax=Gigantopelta aegis TaxID=1735272 RepID=UPI001B88A16C|nr:uncharacterized protein LOC121389869 [Gigantopelta aegis]
MLLFILILGVCGIVVKGECETDYYVQKLRDCALFIRISASTPDEYLAMVQCRLLSVYRQDLTCGLDVVNECTDSPQLMYRGYTMEALRTKIQTSRDVIDTKCA